MKMIHSHSSHFFLSVLVYLDCKTLHLVICLVLQVCYLLEIKLLVRHVSGIWCTEVGNYTLKNLYILLARGGLELFAKMCWAEAVIIAGYIGIEWYGYTLPIDQTIHNRSILKVCCNVFTRNTAVIMFLVFSKLIHYRMLLFLTMCSDNFSCQRLTCLTTTAIWHSQNTGKTVM